MHKHAIAAFTLLAIVTLSACSKTKEPNAQDMVVGMNHYLESQGDLCLAKSTWPIDVTQREMDAGGRNALQMPVLEKLGLVSSSIATIEVKDEDRSANIQVKRYDLTEAGKKYYLTKEMRSMASDGTTRVRQGDFCAAKLSLDSVVKWEPVKSSDGQQRAVVTYTYKVAAAPWTSDAEIQKVFPVVARIVKGAGTEQLQETLKMTDKGWVANES